MKCLLHSIMLHPRPYLVSINLCRLSVDIEQVPLKSLRKCRLPHAHRFFYSLSLSFFHGGGRVLIFI